MTLYFTNLGGRASPKDFTAAVAAALVVICSGPRNPSSTRSLCEFRFRRGTLLCDSRRPSFTDSFCDCSIVGAGRVVCSGPRRPSFTRRPFDFGFCRGTALCNPKRPSFTNKRRWSCLSLRAKKTPLHQRTRRFQILSRHCAIPRGRASPTSSSTAGATALVVSVAPGPSDPASPSVPNFSTAAAQNSAESLACSWCSPAWSCVKAQPGRHQFHPYRHGGTNLHGSLFTPCSGSPLGMCQVSP